MLTAQVTATVARIGPWLDDLYALDLELDAARYVMSPESARALRPTNGPRTGVLIVEEEREVSLGLYVDERDAGDLGTIVEETSHLVCLAWHAKRGLQVSPLLLELQGDIDRYLFRRLYQNRGDEAVASEAWVWAEWLHAPGSRHLLERYRSAHRRAQRYCRGLQRRFPNRADVPELLCELRAFYRAAPDARLRRAEHGGWGEPGAA